MVFEDTQPRYTAWQPPAWVLHHRDRIGHLVLATPTAQRKAVRALSQSRNAGWVDVTHDVLPNPWDTLSSYWASVAPICRTALVATG